MTNEEWSFSYPDKGNKRKAYRTTFPGLYVYLQETSEYLSVRDISAAGVSFARKSSVKTFQEKEKVEISIYLDTEPILQNVEGEVVRIDQNSVPMQFVNLTKKQEYALDKLVLDIQKMQIQRDKDLEE